MADSNVSSRERRQTSSPSQQKNSMNREVLPSGDMTGEKLRISEIRPKGTAASGK